MTPQPNAQLVCLPVRSFRGTFAWTTSALCLHKLRRMLDLAGVPDLPEAPAGLADTDAHHFDEGDTKTALTEEKRVYLEDLDFIASPCPIATAWATKIAAYVFPDDSHGKTNSRSASSCCRTVLSTSCAKRDRSAYASEDR